ncbi:MAG TPA: hypothetical protein VF184_12595 [Phycisphaeraceae bacterium]
MRNRKRQQGESAWWSWLITAALGGAILAWAIGCETTEGVGRDIEGIGEDVQDVAE